MKRYISKSFLLNAMVKERDKAVLRKMPSGHLQNFREAFRIALRVIDQAPTNEIVHCRDCVHWRTYSSECPMLYEEWFDDEDDGLDIVTHDNTPIDGSGFCHLAEKRRNDDD